VRSLDRIILGAIAVAAVAGIAWLIMVDPLPLKRGPKLSTPKLAIPKLPGPLIEDDVSKRMLAHLIQRNGFVCPDVTASISWQEVDAHGFRVVRVWCGSTDYFRVTFGLPAATVEPWPDRR
jgi:hypothetical protein